MANGVVIYLKSAVTNRGATLLRLQTRTMTLQNFLGAGERLHISRHYNNAFLTFSSSYMDSRHLLVKFESICRLPELQKSVTEVLAIATSWHVESAVFAFEAKVVYTIQKFVFAATTWDISHHYRADPCLEWAIICPLKLRHKSCFTGSGAYLRRNEGVLHVHECVLDTESM